MRFCKIITECACSAYSRHISWTSCSEALRSKVSSYTFVVHPNLKFVSRSNNSRWNRLNFSIWSEQRSQMKTLGIASVTQCHKYCYCKRHEGFLWDLAVIHSSVGVEDSFDYLQCLSAPICTEHIQRPRSSGLQRGRKHVWIYKTTGYFQP